MPEARYLDPSKVLVALPAQDSGARVEIKDEYCVPNAQFRLLLPLSDPKTFVAIQDAKKNEIGVMRSLDGMEAPSRAVVEQIIDRQYFTPKVSKINYLIGEAGMWHFKVETSRGDAEYFVRNWRDSAHEISANRWLVHSVDGQRFEIPKVDDLDVQSQNLMDQLL